MASRGLVERNFAVLLPATSELTAVRQLADFRLSLKRIIYLHNGADYKAIQEDDGYPVIGSGGQFAYASQYMYDGESVLFGRKGTIDKPLYIKGKFWTVDTMFYSEPIHKDKTSCKFVYYVAKTIPFERYKTATALPSMTQTDIGSNPIAFPNSLDEQEQIASYLDAETARIDTRIAKRRKQIELLQEYKQALITAAVTGKIDVRESRLTARALQ